MGYLTNLARAGIQESPAETIREGMRALWQRHGCLDHPDFPEAVALALAHPEMALDSLRAAGVIR